DRVFRSQSGFGHAICAGVDGRPLLAAAGGAAPVSEPAATGRAVFRRLQSGAVECPVFRRWRPEHPWLRLPESQPTPGRRGGSGGPLSGGGQWRVSLSVSAATACGSIRVPWRRLRWRLRTALSRRRHWVGLALAGGQRAGRRGPRPGRRRLSLAPVRGRRVVSGAPPAVVVRRRPPGL